MTVGVFRCVFDRIMSTKSCEGRMNLECALMHMCLKTWGYSEQPAMAVAENRSSSSEGCGHSGPSNSNSNSDSDNDNASKQQQQQT